MTKKEVKILLSESGIIKTQQVPMDKLNEYNNEDLIETSIGYYLLQTNDLNQDDITNALLAKLVKNTNTIKTTCVFFVVLSVISIIFWIAAIV